MKYSRDLAREKLNDKSFDKIIQDQVSQIAGTGATHIAIATPYDEEFFPFLTRWVMIARKHNLKVWFRGNWSGWEKWFGYPRISREEHLKKTEGFILKHRELFEDGDAFSSCPECENGGPGDARHTGDVDGHRKFLISEYQATQSAFRAIGKTVRSNLFSMNGDVARLIMDQETTRAMGGVVTIDHYVKTPEQLVKDIESISKTSGGRIILGEFGAPIPDIHGEMTEQEQAKWIGKILELLSQADNIEGINYWLAVGGSTEIWTNKNQTREAVTLIKSYFKPTIVYGFVQNELGYPIANASLKHTETQTLTDENGRYILRFSSPLIIQSFSVKAAGYEEEFFTASQGPQEINIVLKKDQRNWFFHWLVRIKKMAR